MDGEPIVRIPVIRGLIDRRILVNYRVRPDLLARMLPAPFRPKLINGSGIAGVCLIRLKHVRPKFLPAFLGLSSENAAHRFAVEWDDGGETKEGVYVPRRDTSSKINTLLGGRLFPGMQSHADFQIQEKDGHFRIELTSDDRHTHLLVEGNVADELPADSVFGTLANASDFLERGSLGYSATAEQGRFDGIELHSFNWKLRPLHVNKLKSSFFENVDLFPPGSLEFDCAFLMQGIEHEWHGKDCLCAGS